MTKPNYSLRVDPALRDLLRETNRRLNKDPGFEQVLRTLLDDPERTDFVAADTLEQRFRAIERRLKKLETR